MRLHRILLVPFAALPLALAACDSDPETVVVPQATQSPPSTVVVPEDDDNEVIIDRD